jgi:hypothetical protein
LHDELKKCMIKNDVFWVVTPCGFSIYTMKNAVFWVVTPSGIVSIVTFVTTEVQRNVSPLLPR